MGLVLGFPPFPLIYGLIDQFKSNVKKQERSPNVWNFLKFHKPVETTGRRLAESCTLRQSKTVSVPRSWGTTWSFCRCWGQKKNCVENGVLLASCLIGIVSYHRCQSRLHLNSMGMYRTWLASYILAFVTVSDGTLFKSLAFSLIFSLIHLRTLETAIRFLRVEATSGV